MTEFFSDLSNSVIWFVLGLIFLFLELVAPGLVVFFFGLGALTVSIVLAFVDVNVIIQILIFSITSVLYLFLLRNKLKNIFYGKEKNALKDDDDFIGKKAHVAEAIKPEKDGRVEIYGTQWKAEADIEIEMGVAVIILEKNNITLKVKPYGEK